MRCKGASTALSVLVSCCPPKPWPFLPCPQILGGCPGKLRVCRSLPYILPLCLYLFMSLPLSLVLTSIRARVCPRPFLSLLTVRQQPTVNWQMSSAVIPMAGCSLEYTLPDGRRVQVQGSLLMQQQEKRAKHGGIGRQKGGRRKRDRGVTHESKSG